MGFSLIHLHTRLLIITQVGKMTWVLGKNNLILRNVYAQAATDVW